MATSPQLVLAGDLDDDLDLDLITVNSGSGNVTVLLNNGAGVFGSRVDYAGLTQNVALALGDVDGDGDLDLIAGTNADVAQTLALLLNDGTGAFAAPTLFDGDRNQSVALRDVDDDDGLDLVAVSFALGGSILVLRNDGTGEFARLAIDQTEFSLLSASSIGAIAMGDLDGDSDLDIAISHYGDDNVSELRNDGAGGFGPPTAQPNVFLAQYVDYAVGDGPLHVAVGDIDGDGDLDIATADRRDSSVTVLDNDGTAGFGTPLFPTGSAPNSLALGDVNGDGILDAVTGNSGSESDAVSVLLGDGAGGFGPRQNLAAGLSTRSVALGDMDGDGDLDIVTASVSSGPHLLCILLNDGAGGFNRRLDYVVGSRFTHDVRLGDVDGDGDLDIVAVSSQDSSLTVFIVDRSV